MKSVFAILFLSLYVLAINVNASVYSVPLNPGDNKNMQVAACPILAVSVTNPTNCGGLGTLNFTFTNVPNGAYKINFSSGSFQNVAVSNGKATVNSYARTYNNLTITVDECTSPSGINATVMEGQPPNPPSVSVDNICGESVLTASDYSGTLLWSTGENTESITITKADNYSVTQTISGCTSNAITVAAAPLAIPTLSVSGTNPLVCLTDGTLDFSFTNVPLGIYDISYDGGTLENTIVIGSQATVFTSSGNYNNLKINVNGCVSKNGVNVTLTDPNAPNPPDISVEDDCGESKLIASNFTGNLKWSTGETTNSIIVTEAGEYSVTQTINSCTSEAAIENASPVESPVLAVSSQDPQPCVSNGKLLFTFTGVPDGTYIINYDGGAFSDVSVSGSAATIDAAPGIYNNLFISLNNCSSPGGINAVIGESDKPGSPDLSVESNCGESILTASNYSGTLLWNTGEITESIIVTEDGKYSVTQTVGDCTSDAAIDTITIQMKPTIEVHVTNPVNCGDNGSLEFTFTNVPDGSHTILYDGGEFTNVTVENNSASVIIAGGIYNNLNLTVNNCTSNKVNAVITDAVPPDAPIVTVSNNCGESVLTASGYTGTLLWSTGDTTASIIVTEAGEYTVSQTVNSCNSANAIAEALPKIIPVMSIETTGPETCNGQGIINFTFTNLPAGFEKTVTLFNADTTFSEIYVSNNMATLEIEAGVYSDLRINVNGCLSNAVTAILTDPEPPASPVISVEDGCGESILTASGYTGTLQWSTGDTTESITVSEAGIYSVTQTLNGCISEEATVEALPKTLPLLSVIKTDPTVCEGQGTLEFTFTNVPDGEYTIHYAQGEFPQVEVTDSKAFLEVPAGSYYNLTVTFDGCVSPNGINAILTSPDAPQPPTISVQNNCGESVLTASNYTGKLSWNTGETTESIIVTEPGDYLVTQTVNACISDAAVINANPIAIPTLSVSAILPENCIGDGQLNFTFTNVPNGNYTITFNGGTFNNIAVNNNKASIRVQQGTYNNLVILVGNCSSADGKNITVESSGPPSTPIISAENQCGQSILTASKYTGELSWNTGESTQSITIKESGVYSLTQTVKGCTSNPAYLNVSVKSIPSLSVSKSNPEECQGSGSLNFNFSGVPNGNYSINYTGGIFENVSVANNRATVSTPAGTFSNLTISVNQCTSSAGISAVISDPNPPDTPIVSVENNCGESILTASEFTGDLKWNTGEITPSIIVTEAGEYSVKQTVDGCSSDATVVTVSPKEILDPPDFLITQNCDNTSTLLATNFELNASLSWSTGETGESITVNSADSYSLTQIINGCESEPVSKFVQLKSSPALNASVINPEDCTEQGTINFAFSGVPDGTYTINYDGGKFDNVIVANEKATVQAESGLYHNLTISVDDCNSAEEVNVEIKAPNSLAAPTITVENKCGESVLTAGDYLENADLLWSTSETTETISVSEAGTYTLTQSLSGCKSSFATAKALPGVLLPKPEVQIDNNCSEILVTVGNLETNSWIFWEHNNNQDSTQNNSFNLVETGNYIFYQKSDNCISDDTLIVINSFSSPQPPLSLGDKSVCEADPMPELLAEADPPAGNYEVIWYSQAEGGSKVNSPVLNKIGTVTYYAESQSRTGDCVSLTRTPVTLSINTGPITGIRDTDIVGKPNSQVAVLIFPKNELKYQWYMNDKEISGAEGQYYYISESQRKDGNVFSVEVEMNNGCSSLFAYSYPSKLNSGAITGSNNNKSSELTGSFVVYPNPANNRVFVALNDFNITEGQKLTIKIYSVNGACILSTPFDVIPKSVDTETFQPGIYSVLLYSDMDLIGTKTLIIRK